MRLRRREMGRNIKRKRITEEHRSDWFNCKAAKLYSGDVLEGCKSGYFICFILIPATYVGTILRSGHCRFQLFAPLLIVPCNVMDPNLQQIREIINGQKGGQIERMKIRKIHK
jgi:hypothetical protein